MTNVVWIKNEKLIDGGPNSTNNNSKLVDNGDLTG